MDIETRDADFALQDIQLVIGAENDVLNGIQRAELAGGTSGNILDASAFTLGSVVLKGLGGADQLLGGLLADDLTGGTGNDLLRGKGDDRLICSKTTGAWTPSLKLTALEPRPSTWKG